MHIAKLIQNIKLCAVENKNETIKTKLKKLKRKQDAI